MTVELSDPEMMRYNRQIVLRGFDFEGEGSAQGGQRAGCGHGRAGLRSGAIRLRRASAA